MDYETVVGYAKTLCAKRDVPPDLVLDIAHDAWIEISLKLGGDFEVANRRAFEQRVAFTAILDAIRKHRRWGGHDAGFSESDAGAGAERAYFAADDWEEPFWLRLFWATHQQIRADAKTAKGKPGVLSKSVPKTIQYLLSDSRLAIAREKLMISYPAFRRILEILQMRFALCYQALRAWRATQLTFTFSSDKRLYKCRR